MHAYEEEDNAPHHRAINIWGITSVKRDLMCQKRPNIRAQ
jgi:hypothetical protein